MTPNVAGPIFNLLAAAFFIVVIIGVALGAYAATRMKRLEQEAHPQDDTNAES